MDRGEARALAGALPVGRVAGGLARGVAMTLKRAQGAEVGLTTLGRFTRVVWEILGRKGAGFVRWNRVLIEDGSTLRLCNDVFGHGGDFLRRDLYRGGPR